MSIPIQILMCTLLSGPLPHLTGNDTLVLAMLVDVTGMRGQSELALLIPFSEHFASNLPLSELLYCSLLSTNAELSSCRVLSQSSEKDKHVCIVDINGWPLLNK